jgi:hypothetical protein
VAEKRRKVVRRCSNDDVEMKKKEVRARTHIY